MSELQVTQCPYCKTHFRLTHEQLHAAAGNVRCGACLKVFNALPQPVVAAKPASTPPTRTTRPAPADQTTLLIHDDLELDELDLEALGLDESILDEVNPRPQGSPPAGIDEPTTSSDDPARNADDAPSVTDAEPESPAQRHDDIEFDEAFLSAAPSRDILTARDDAGPAADAPPNTPPAQAPQPTFVPHARVMPLQDSDDDHPLMRRDRREPALPSAVESDFANDHTKDHEPDVGDVFHLPDLHDEPLHFEAPLSRRRARHNWLWGTLCVLALAGLIAQAALYNLDAWSRDDRLRPALENLCLVAGCELPARVDVSQIRSSNLLVRPHPEFPNTLDINLIIYNRADYDQPFPLIRMTFSDSRGRAVATRDFRPTEYLAGELAGRTLMPSQTPIHIALSMVAPAQQSTSYQLDFVTP